MTPLKFQLDDATFHREVFSWPGVTKHMRDGLPRYNFDRMAPVQQPVETVVVAPSQEILEPLIPVVRHFNT